MVKDVGNLIATFCQSYREWDKNLPLLTLVNRSSTHEVTGYTPNFVVTWREVTLPLDIMLGTLEGADKMTAPEYVQKLQTRLKGCFEKVCMHLKQQGEWQPKYYNLSTHWQAHKPGEVLVRCWLHPRPPRCNITIYSSHATSQTAHHGSSVLEKD